MKKDFLGRSLIVLVMFLMLAVGAQAGSADAATVTVMADSPGVYNCYPFGGGGNGWDPYAGFIYQNVPAFNLMPGDTLAFDLGAQNDTDIELEIAMAPTTVNGGDVEAGPFTTVVTNTQTPANPRGDITIGNYELQFVAEAPFNFPGGGLIIRFSNPSAAYSADGSCDQVLVSAESSDTSGFFRSRFYNDADGVSPWITPDDGSIGGFQVITGNVAAGLGVADDVPGTDVVIPLICEKDGTMNTLWAVGDLFAGGAADILVYDRRSELVYDDFEEWTSDAPDVVVSDCQSLVASMSEMQRAALEMSIGSRTYYAGYLVYFNVDANSDQFIPWVYLVDLTRGFASGYNGFAAEGGVNLLTLGEGLGLAPVTATALFPRYYIGNDNAETWNWWITLLGSNDPDRELAGFICNEEEDCVSLSIPIPDELNIIDVEPYVPAGLHVDYPKAGMGVFGIVNGDDQFDITTLGWSYQRLEASTVSASWDVIHPMHRVYFDIRN